MGMYGDLQKRRNNSHLNAILCQRRTLETNMQSRGQRRRRKTYLLRCKEHRTKHEIQGVFDIAQALGEVLQNKVLL